ncbi:MAG: bifunctional DNA primase/polymerase [Sphingopyxis sp.]
MNPNLSLARGYARNNVAVFPCREAGEKVKSPYIANGFHRASCDENLIGLWNGVYPTAIYGLPCAGNNLVVLDADRHGAGDGVQSLFAMFDHHGFDCNTVPIVETPRNGIHAIFQRPKHLGKAKGKLCAAVDVKDNGYIIVPGTIMPDGRAYHLLNGTVEQLAYAIGAATLPIAPFWLTALLETQIVAPTEQRQTNFSAEGLENSLRGLVRKVVEAPEGCRNSILYWSSCRLGELVAQGDVDQDTALGLLIEAGQQAGLARHEAVATARSGLQQHGC